MRTPTITSVSPIVARQKQTFTISGRGFGSQTPFHGDLPCFEVRDITRGWAAGHIDPAGGSPYSGDACSAPLQPLGDTITLDVSSWTDSRIVVDGFEGSYGNQQYGWYLSPGDELQIRVWNAQLGTGPSYITQTVDMEVGGLDLRGYCLAHGDDEVKLLAGNVEGWRCVRGPTLLAIDMVDACRWQYPDHPAVRAVYRNHDDAMTWYCLG
jgi:hypothetical protein